MKALFLDRDGTINIDYGYVCEPERFVLIDGVARFCRKAQALGFAPIVITNQSGVARGYYTEAQMRACNEHMCARLADEGVKILDVFTCTAVDAADPDRKPNPGMFLKAQAKYGIDMAQSISVGDKERDIAAAVAAGVGTNWLFSGDYGVLETELTKPC